MPISLQKATMLLHKDLYSSAAITLAFTAVLLLGLIRVPKTFHALFNFINGLCFYIFLDVVCGYYHYVAPYSPFLPTFL